ncbi:MAG: dihydrolipoamide acetyltransferase family protein [Thermanaerothrix sp.]|uniref:Dihydrolipoamide acetyltransferase component of pyruvate dehydrogenase complex n=1 Tax=Thermanaerothrix solaris TaxID=3058434 RepID=A0ABU3NII4_9CHLR|nr:dihydrolipoamide acetyltransferase family protein [Thermanaerothrix sp. 4228-RoL]MDT8896666.1 dihydrolipoamide acetyltransferase family protein [Thermanaerothrix sp. 4228-RoL]
MAEVITMPKLGFDMAEGTLIRWLKAEGEAVTKGEILAEIETDKATVEVESTHSGVVRRLLVEAGAVVPVGTPIAVIGAPDESIEDVLPGEKKGEQAEEKTPTPAVSSKTTEMTPLPVTESGVPIAEGRIKASPLARRMAREHQLDLRQIRGSGPGGRIVRRDIEAALAAQPEVVTPPAVSAKPSEVVPPTPVVSAWKPVGEVPEDQHIPVDRLRSIIARRMVEAKQQVPHFYITREYDMGALMELRKALNAELPEEQRLSVNDFVIKAVALTLRQFPALNAALVGNEIVRYGHVNIGVAVALESGLMTVVCRDADLKPLRLISQEMKDLSARARQGKVRPEDIEGSTFSISNLGMFGVEHFMAIINPPEAAILAVGAVREVPVVQNGALGIGLRMKATLSADHRVTDGAEAARFMQLLADFLEHPYRLVL